MSLQEIGLLLGSVFASVVGQFLLKAGALKLGKVTGDNWLSHVLSMATTWELAAGMTAYGLGAIAYILLLTRVKLSVAAPSVSLIYVFAVLIGVLAYGEALPIARAIGVALIMAGVVLVASQS
jgi:drug/metabolite transporter (DMT)-like permease